MEWSLVTLGRKTDKRRYASRIVTTTFTEISMELEFISEEFSRNVEFLTTDYDDMLTVENLFCDG